MMSSTLSVCEYISRAIQSKTSSNTYSTAAKYRLIFVEQIDEGVSLQRNPALSAYLIKIVFAPAVVYRLHQTGDQRRNRKGEDFHFPPQNIPRCL